MGYKALVVDDYDFMRRTLIRMFRGHPVVTELLEASDGREALSVVEANSDLALIVTDVDMPVMNGPAMLQEMPRKYATTHYALPSVIMGSGVPDNRTKYAGVLTACQGTFLDKPYGVKELLALVDQALVKYEARRAEKK